MDYKEKYNQALKRARNVYTYYCDDREQLRKIESIFPELKKSEDEKIKQEILELVSIAGNGNQFEEIKDWLEKQGKKLDPDKVIEWLKHRELSCDDVVITVIPDDSPTSVPHRVKWLSDEFIKQFKKDFGL